MEIIGYLLLIIFFIILSAVVDLLPIAAGIMLVYLTIKAFMKLFSK